MQRGNNPVSPTWILLTIVVSQFLCTSVWFAGNAVLPELSAQYALPPAYLSYLTSAVQLGFISGTLALAVFSVADRFRPASLFFLCAVAAAVSNAALTVPGLDRSLLLPLRFAAGCFLAGIYPVGMKIAADHFREGLGKSLGLLVGALVLGTALPHLLRSITAAVHWQTIILIISLLCLAGGASMRWLLPEGPYRQQGQRLRFSSIYAIWRQPGLRKAALGYFGHMWELYAFWAFVPVLFQMQQQHAGASYSLPFVSFLTIATGSIACVAAGSQTRNRPPAKIATACLLVSGTCCVLSPLMVYAPLVLFLPYMLIWGGTVVADSPLFSTIIAQEAPGAIRGSVITLITSIGFAITIISIQLTACLLHLGGNSAVFALLATGPVLGVWVLLRNKKATE